MKYCLYFGIITAALAQSTTQSATVDINGYRVPGPLITSDNSGRTERMQSINGRTIPLEKVVERVLRDDASGRVVERTIQRFDPNGNPTPPERILIEQRGSTTSTTRSQEDINANYRVIERSVTETHKSGSVESLETAIQRPTINDSMETVEKQAVTKTSAPGGFEQDVVTYRLGANGFYEAARRVTNRQQQAAGTHEDTAEYEVGPSGRLVLHSRTLINIARQPDGSETEVRDIFGQFVPGSVGTEGSSLKLKERDTTKRREAADGSVHETLFVQRPTLADPGVLGPNKAVSETVCRGKCR